MLLEDQAMDTNPLSSSTGSMPGLAGKEGRIVSVAIREFEKLLDVSASRAPERHLFTIGDFGAVTGLLGSDAARPLTGNVVFVHAGDHVMR